MQQHKLIPEELNVYRRKDNYYPECTTPAGVEFIQIHRHSYKHMTSLRSSWVKLLLI
jgi:hypothetical protein